MFSVIVQLNNDYFPNNWLIFVMETAGVLCEDRTGLLCATDIHIMLQRANFGFY